MATRSTIALEFADGTVGQIYCHWDGYISNNGRILFESYQNPFKVRDLIDLGSVSSLGEIIGTKHPFSQFDTTMPKDEYENLYGKMTTFYGRDRGETGIEARYFKDFADYKANFQGEEFDYILRQVDGVATWFVSDHGGDFVLLTEALVSLEETV